ncbi:MAG TPA: type II secretion system F family protein [Mycobacteriales bacterium]|nr:type II secretion system F family protein [Mycobacteriales bacterium]HWA68157.1 type II secretion system F family protein [Mycobacteriales bacterium]
MATTLFKYQVRDRTGKLISGELQAETEAALVSRLRSMGYAPVSISQGNTGMQKEITIPGFGKKVKLKDLAIFSRQFATMINSGLSLMRSLTILAEQTENPELARLVGEVRNEVEAGNSLSVAMGKFPKVFPPLMVNLCRAGEIGGFLDTVLLQIAENYEAEVKLRSKIKSAMTYPVVVGCIALIALTVMLTFVVPTFANIFASLGSKLPAPTQMLVDISHWMKYLIPAGIIGGIAGMIVWRRIRDLEKVRAFVDPLKLKVPVFGPLFQKVAIARFARNLGTMIKSGVPILQALEIVADTTGNWTITQAVHDVQDSVRQGEALTQPLSQHDVFPPMVVQMMAVGEDTGALDTMLAKIAEFYDQEVEATTESLTALIEPIMIAVLGGLVGGMIVCLYLPIFSVYNHIGS